MKATIARETALSLLRDCRREGMKRADAVKKLVNENGFAPWVSNSLALEVYGKVWAKNKAVEVKTEKKARNFPKPHGWALVRAREFKQRGFSREKARKLLERHVSDMTARTALKKVYGKWKPAKKKKVKSKKEWAREFARTEARITRENNKSMKSLVYPKKKQIKGKLVVIMSIEDLADLLKGK